MKDPRRWVLIWTKRNGQQRHGARFFFRRNAERHARGLYYEMGFGLPFPDDNQYRPCNVEVGRVGPDRSAS